MPPAACVPPSVDDATAGAADNAGVVRLVASTLGNCSCCNSPACCRGPGILWTEIVLPLCCATAVGRHWVMSSGAGPIESSRAGPMMSSGPAGGWRALRDHACPGCWPKILCAVMSEVARTCASMEQACGQHLCVLGKVQDVLTAATWGRGHTIRDGGALAAY